MDDLLAVEGVDVFFVGPRVYLRMACGTPCRVTHFRLTTLNPNLFGSPTRSDYCFLAGPTGTPDGKGATFLEFAISIWSGDALGIWGGY